MDNSSQHYNNFDDHEKSIREQSQQSNDIKLQIAQHAARLRLSEISDEEKIDSLFKLINLTMRFVEGEWNDIITTSGVIEALSTLILETSNPKIRTLCGAVIEVIQQRGCENGESSDWRTLLSPIVSLLFNSDEKISEIGKQSLLKSIDKNSETIYGLIQLNLFEEASELLEIAFQTSSQTSSSSSNYQYQILPQKILLNILEVVECVIQSNAEFSKKTKKLKKAVEKIILLNPPQPIQDLISSIFSILDEKEQEDEQKEEEENENQRELRIKQSMIQELSIKVIESEDNVRIAELKSREFEEKLRNAEQEKQREKI
ncbi:MAG: hypothetical protein EZS28_013300 [Streblomastix strix]|uniref:Uncharacterized protein n=1 Tax=Streblomastix strix TaxID=222440 RepID=A0A5J4W8G0_9EUKA|nr:MAG: hypothetical protein EZS28_013300 [Streblomastix strix]